MKPDQLSYQLIEIRPGRYVKVCDGKVVGIATEAEIKNYFDTTKNSSSNTNSELGSANITFEKMLRLYSSVVQNLTRQLLFIASILAGFIFTIIYELVLAPQDVNNVLLSINFSFLLVSGFSLLLSIVLGAILQFAGNIEYWDIIRDKEKSLSLLNTDRNLEKNFEFLEPIIGLIIWGTIAAFIAFLFGIFCFIVSVTILGWIRSPWFGCLSTLLVIILVYIISYVIKNIIRTVERDMKRK